jgi:hypothetical protein
MYRYRAKCIVEDCNNAFRNYNYDDYDDDSDLSDERGRSQHLHRSFHNTLVSIFAACRLGGRGNVTATEDDGGIELTRSKIEKFSLQDLYPRRRERNGTPTKDEGGGSMVMIAMAVMWRCRQSKKRGCRSSPRGG